MNPRVGPVWIGAHPGLRWLRLPIPFRLHPTFNYIFLQDGYLNTDKALERFMELTAIPGRSGEEADVAATITRWLVDAGVDPKCIEQDQANQSSRIGGNCGNMIVTLPGDDSLPRVMLSAHMDTVPVCLGAKPILVDGDELEGSESENGDATGEAGVGKKTGARKIVKSSADTGLGADDRAGCTVVVNAIENRMQWAKDHPGEPLPPAVCTFLIQEEIGLVGARHLDGARVGKVDLAFNFDGGTMDKIRHGAIGGERMQIVVRGFASHAGVAPEKGVNAIVIAAKAIASLEERGLMGLIEQDGKRGTTNVGVIQGGEATNVVTPEVFVRVEARSHDGEFRTWIVSQIRQAFEQAATEVTDVSGRCGKIEFTSQVDYEAFKLSEDHPSVQKATQLLAELGYNAVCEVANGGLDANWLYQHGIEAVTLGCGQAAIHTVDEHLLVDHYFAACRLATRVLTEASA